MSRSDINRIKAYVRANGVEEQRNNVMNAKFDTTCPFRDNKNKKCLIYDVRPQICRQFVCNHSEEDIRKAKNLAMKKLEVVDMRHTFYGHSDMFEIVRTLMRGAER